MGEWVDWIVKQVHSLITDKNDILPKKAKSTPFVYWLAAPLHRNFDFEENESRKKMKNCLESVVKTYDNIRIMKLKEFWHYTDDHLVQNNRCTVTGFDTYWKSLDSAVEFNIKKRQAFLAKDSQGLKRQRAYQPDEIATFFKRYKYDKFHWRKDMSYGEDRRQ